MTLADYLAKKQAKKLRRKDNARFIAKTQDKKLMPKRSVLVAKIDSVFSIMIRMRGKKKTGGKCEICFKRPIEVCFHWVSRGDYATRWLPENACASCRGCNYEETFRKQKYRDIFIARFGLSERERIEGLARSNKKFSANELIEMIKNFERGLSDGNFF